jgi:hypothetical protein
MWEEEYAIREAEKATNRKTLERKIAEQKRFFASAMYKGIVWDEDDEVEWYEEDVIVN